LQVTDLNVVGASPLQSGATVTIHWKDANTGTRATTVGWSDSLTVTNLTTNKTLATISIPYDPVVSGNGPIEASDSRQRQLSYQIPEGNAGVGQISFTITTDATNAVFELNLTNSAETNNSASTTVAVSLAPYPDLAVTIVTAPSLVIGDPASLTVSWRVE